MSKQDFTLLDDSFSGYPSPKSNLVYVPNQFFEVVLRHSSRGCARLVGYLILQTFSEGRFEDEPVQIAQNQLAKAAGLSRSQIRPAIDEALERRFIVEIVRSKPDKSGSKRTSALYRLRFSDSPYYTKQLAEFDGFLATFSHRTMVPKMFLSHTLRVEPLSVAKVVGAIIRHTIGFKDEQGFRRREVAKSRSDLSAITGLSDSAVKKGLQQAISKKHINLVKKGVFDPAGGEQSRPGTYGVNWLDSVSRLASQSRPDRKEPRAPQTGSKRAQAERIDSAPETGSKKTPKNRIEMNPYKTNSTYKKHALLISGLVDVGFSFPKARALVDEHGAEAVEAQLNALPLRKAVKNKIGFLKMALMNNYAVPTATKSTKSPSTTKKVEKPAPKAITKEDLERIRESNRAAYLEFQGIEEARERECKEKCKALGLSSNLLAPALKSDSAYREFEFYKKLGLLKSQKKVANSG